MGATRFTAVNKREEGARWNGGGGGVIFAPFRRLARRQLSLPLLSTFCNALSFLVLISFSFVLTLIYVIHVLAEILRLLGDPAEIAT